MKNNPFELSAPICLGIITTNRCNLKCKHCINSASTECMVELNTKQIIDIVDQCKTMGVCFVDFNGGEFFIRNDVEKLLDYTLSNKLNVVITTNGTLITDSWIEKYRGKISLVRISLDNCIEKVHDDFRGVPGAFQQTVNNIRKLIANGFRVTVLSTIRRSSLSSLFDFLDFLDSLHVSAIHTTLLIPAGRGRSLENEVLSPSEHRLFLEMCSNYISEKNPKYLKILEESPQTRLLEFEKGTLIDFSLGKCGAGFTEMVVLNDGYVLPCAAFISVRDKYKTEELNSSKHSLDWIYHHSDLMNAVRDMSRLTGKCQNCKIKEQCGGGCRISALMSCKGIHGEDSMCWC